MIVQLEHKLSLKLETTREIGILREGLERAIESVPDSARQQMMDQIIFWEELFKACKEP